MLSPRSCRLFRTPFTMCSLVKVALPRLLSTSFVLSQIRMLNFNRKLCFKPRREYHGFLFLLFSTACVERRFTFTQHTLVCVGLLGPCFLYGPSLCSVKGVMMRFVLQLNGFPTCACVVCQIISLCWNQVGIKCRLCHNRSTSPFFFFFFFNLYYRCSFSVYCIA